MPGRGLQDSIEGVVLDGSAEESLAGDLLQQHFDPVTFLNNSLPALSFKSSVALDHTSEKNLSLQEVSTQTQAILAKATAQNIRFANGLSQLTDEILRSGSRLAYEVEVLRGNANALHEGLTDTLLEDIRNFAPAGIPDDGENSSDGKSDQARPNAESAHPEFINQLRMLGQVKSRLEEVIGIFGEAMKWPLAPSELSITSSLISVSAPDSSPEGQNREEKGKAFAKNFKADILELLNHKDGGPRFEAAATKVESLRLLSRVWKSTTEERARIKFVDSLTKLVDDKKKQAESRSQPQPRRGSNVATQPSSSTPDRAGVGFPRERWADDSGNGAGGLFRNLQRLRDEIYLD